jgi:hypothetical protein
VSDNVVNLGAVRHLRSVERQAHEAIEEIRQATRVVTAPMIGCGGCEGTKFELLDDGGVVCAGCHTLIVNLQWFDRNSRPPAA